MNKNKATNVTSKLTAQTRTLIDQLCNDNSWSAKVMGCDVKAFEETMAERLEKFQKCADDEKLAFLDGVLDAIPKHLDVLKKDGKGTTAITRAHNFIHAVATECYDSVNDETEFATLCTLRVLKADILKDVEPEGKTSKERNFAPNGNDGKKNELTLYGSWAAKAASTVDEDGNIDTTYKGKCSREIYAKITALVAAGEPSFGNYNMSYILKFSDWVTDRVFDTDGKVIGISTKGSFIDQTKKLLKMYKSEIECGTSSNQPDDNNNEEDSLDISDETRALYKKFMNNVSKGLEPMTIEEFNKLNDIQKYLSATCFEVSSDWRNPTTEQLNKDLETLKQLAAV